MLRVRNCFVGVEPQFKFRVLLTKWLATHLIVVAARCRGKGRKQLASGLLASRVGGGG